MIRIVIICIIVLSGGCSTVRGWFGPEQIAPNTFHIETFPQSDWHHIIGPFAYQPVDECIYLDTWYGPTQTFDEEEALADMFTLNDYGYVGNDEEWCYSRYGDLWLYERKN